MIWISMQISRDADYIFFCRLRPRTGPQKAYLVVTKSASPKSRDGDAVNIGCAAEWRMDARHWTVDGCLSTVKQFWQNLPKNYQAICKIFGKFLAKFRSFSAVSAPIFASKYAFFSISFIYKIIWLNFQKISTFCRCCNICKIVCWNFTKIADFSNRFFC